MWQIYDYKKMIFECSILVNNIRMHVYLFVILSDNFIYINESKSWIDALEYCRSHHQTLVRVLNDTAQMYITRMLRGKHVANGVWIGLERNMLFHSSPWLWTGGPYVDYAMWHPNFPADPMSNYCGKILTRNNTYGWMDACCFERLPFICQVSIYFSFLFNILPMLLLIVNTSVYSVHFLLDI